VCVCVYHENVWDCNFSLNISCRLCNDCCDDVLCTCVCVCVCVCDVCVGARVFNSLVHFVITKKTKKHTKNRENSSLSFSLSLSLSLTHTHKHTRTQTHAHERTHIHTQKFLHLFHTISVITLKFLTGKAHGYHSICNVRQIQVKSISSPSVFLF